MQLRSGAFHATDSLPNNIKRVSFEDTERAVCRTLAQAAHLSACKGAPLRGGSHGLIGCHLDPQQLDVRFTVKYDHLQAWQLLGRRRPDSSPALCLSPQPPGR